MVKIFWVRLSSICFLSFVVREFVFLYFDISRYYSSPSRGFTWTRDLTEGGVVFVTVPGIKVNDFVKLSTLNFIRQSVEFF